MMALALLLAGALSAAVAALATGLVLIALRQWAVLDVPNPRSSHVAPTPRGGGLAVIATIVVAWGATAWAAGDARTAGILAVAIGLAAVAWRDDRGELPVALRLAVHVAAVALGLYLLPGSGWVFQGLLPPWADIALAGLAWLWFVNLFNFMDGIDGLAAGESTAVALGLVLAGLLAGSTPEALLYAATLAGAALGFLRWNWAPAQVFLGDIGSIPLGYLLGWLLLLAAVRGQWALALVLPAYYWADASLTLLRRARRGERIWQAHRSHFYQQAARRWRSHARVVAWVAAGNAVLIVAAAVAVAAPALAWGCVVFALLPTALLLWYFANPAGEAADGS